MWMMWMIFYDGHDVNPCEKDKVRFPIGKWENWKSQLFPPSVSLWLLAAPFDRKRFKRQRVRKYRNPPNPPRPVERIHSKRFPDPIFLTESAPKWNFKIKRLKTRREKSKFLFSSFPERCPGFPCSRINHVNFSREMKQLRFEKLCYFQVITHRKWFSALCGHRALYLAPLVSLLGN